MNPMIKKSFTLFAVSCILSASAHVFAADSSINVVVDGQPLAFTDAMPQLKDDRTYVPYRAVFEALDATVNFDSATNTVTAQRDGLSVSFVIGSSQVTIAENGQSETIQTDAATYIDPETNRTMVPVRFAAQALDCVVNWNQTTKAVDIIDTSSINLLDGYWQNNIQAPMVYRFFANGTVQEYTMEPGTVITEENLTPSRSFSYRFTNNQLVLEWGEDYETVLDPVTAYSPVTFEMLSSEIPDHAVFFYETSWVDTGIPDNAQYLTQVPSTELSASSQVASAEQFSSHISYLDGKLSFTVPEGTQTWKIFISGRVELEDFGGMSVHYLEDATWENGKSYSFDVSQGGYTDLQLNAYCEGQELSMDLLPFLLDALKTNTSTP